VINDQLLAFDKVRDVVAKRCHVGFQITGPFLETHQHAGLAEFVDAVDQKGHCEQRLAAAGGATQQGRPTCRETAEGQGIQPLYPRGRLA
jgi:hypothetical protein